MLKTGNSSWRGRYMSPGRNAWRKPCVANMAPSISAFGVGYDPMRRDRAATHDESVRMNLGCPESEFWGRDDRASR